MSSKLERIARPARFERAGLDRTARTVPVTLATDTPIRHGGRDVVLRHGADALDLEGITADGIPLLVSHNGQSLPIGRLKELHMAEHETTAVAHFGRSQEALARFQDVEDGIITDVSVGADPSDDDAIEAITPDLVRVNRWRPIEGSLVAVGADARAKIHRTEGKTMPFEVIDDGGARKNRTAEIRRIFSGLDGAEWRELHIKALESDDSVDAIKDSVVERLKSASVRIQSAPAVQAVAGQDQGEKFVAGARASLLQRMGVLKGDEKKANDELVSRSEFAGMSLLELAREYLRRNNVSTQGLDRMGIARAALFTRGIISHSTSDLTSITADAANKTLRIGYEEAPTTWAQWCGTGSLPDFKTAQFPNLSSFSNVDEIVNDEEYQYGQLADAHEVGTLGTYGKLISFGRKLIVNDDLGALERVSRAMGQAQARQLNSAVYGLLTANAAMNEDAVALFHANHGNLTASGGAPSVAQLNTGFTSMGTQNALGPDGGAQTGAVLNLSPEFLIVPKALEVTARTVQAAADDPAEGTTTSFRAPNPFRNRFTVVADAVLDATSAVEWYLAAAANQIDTVNVFFLDGATSPMLEQQEGFVRDGVIFKTRHDWAAVVMDFRGLYKNAGA